MGTKVTPIFGDNPGWCDVEPCTQEAVVNATLPLPGEGGKVVAVKFCRQCWAEVDEAEETDLRKTGPGFEHIVMAALPRDPSIGSD